MSIKINTLKLAGLACISLFLQSCNKEEIQAPDGNIVGFVHLIDEFEYPLHEKSDVKVSLKNTPYTVLTNEAGRFELQNVVAGTYDITFEKEGYGTRTITGYQFVGGNIPGLATDSPMELYQFPSIWADNWVIYSSEGYIMITATLSSPVKEYAGRFFFSTNPDVSDKNYDYSRSFFANGSDYSMPHTKLHASLSLDIIFYHAFNPGDEVYLVAYFHNTAESSLTHESSLVRGSEPVKLVLE